MTATATAVLGAYWTITCVVVLPVLLLAVWPLDEQLEQLPVLALVAAPPTPDFDDWLAFACDPALETALALPEPEVEPLFGLLLEGAGSVDFDPELFVV